MPQCSVYSLLVYFISMATTLPVISLSLLTIHNKNYSILSSHLLLYSFELTAYNFQNLSENTILYYRAERILAQKLKLPNEESLLGVGNECANISKSHDKEGNCLHIKEDKVVIFPKQHIIATAEEEVESNSKFQQVNPNDSSTKIT